MNVTDSRSARSDSEPSGALVSALTTEHYTLQTARSSTVAKANGRGPMFLSTVSGAIVALALVAQVDRLGQTRLVFAGHVASGLGASGLLLAGILIGFVRAGSRDPGRARYGLSGR